MKRELTSEQRDFVTANHNLILSFLHLKNLPIWESDPFTGEDWYGTAALGLCKAASIFDPQKKYKFSTLAYHCMHNEVALVYRRLNAQSRIPTDKEFSYDAECDNNDSEFTLFSMLSGNCDTLDEVITKVLCEQVIESMSAKEKKVIHLLSKGYGQKEVANIVGISQTYVSRIKTKFKQKMCG